ncbi:MAG TPA: carbohydrate porin [Candidatus Methylacidiphilales bacterium]
MSSKLPLLGLFVSLSASAIAGDSGPLRAPVEPDSKTVTPVASHDAFASWLDGDYATGDWGGTRTALRKSGYEFFGYGNAIIAGNVSGGREKSSAYAHDFYFGAKFDLGKIAGVKGLTFLLSGVNRDGTDISPQVGSRYSVMQLVGGQNTFLYQVALEQKLLGDKLAVKAGRLSAGDDFANSPLFGYYLNNGIDGNLRAVLFDTAFSSYPFPVWGGRVRLDPTPEFNVQSGVYQTSDRMFSHTDNGLDYSMRDSDGFQWVTQAGWTPEFAKTEGKNGALRGLRGNYYVGGYWSDWHYQEFGKTSRIDNSYGLYALASQEVYQAEPGTDKGLVLFGTVTYAPQQNISIIPFQLSGGAQYKGLLPDRPEDRAIFGIIHGEFSQNYANTLAAQSLGYAHSETVLEWGYRVQLTKWAYIQPDLQYVATPGGTGRTPDAVVVGTQFGVSF